MQLGEAKEGEAKPKRASLPKGTSPDDVDLETALGLLSLPREVGRHPESGETILAGIGRFGPYLKLGDSYVSLSADDDVLTVGLNRAVTVIADGKKRRGGGSPLREVGPHPKDKKPITVMSGRYGPYLKHDGINAPLPKGVAAETISLEDAIAQLEARGKPAGRRRKAGAAKTPAAKKTTAKKTAKKKTSPKKKSAAKKPAAKKSAAKKPAPRKSTAARKRTGTSTTTAGE